MAHPLLLEVSVCEFLYEKCERGEEWACREYEESCVEPFFEETTTVFEEVEEE